MNLVDSSGWLEFFTDGPLAGKYFNYIEKLDMVVVPALIIYEVYKKIKKERDEESALLAVGHMARAKVVPLDESLAMSSADISLKHNLSMADAIIYATALRENAKLITSDKHFLGLANVVLLKKL
ncbi:MAG: twitching motility protein PilT [Omnitrophica WOR_2 bacterium RIFOXYA2_FULL_45_12]|nr:MAG: twitching motility protein PilT [Omnitrophica WOR_2 bacterium RIFOXYA2_FULL_45_12]OGX60720.1 MAG: twitching motility protein PilT [Omnitrophica WOR_2 bacterium RIFOXYC2_FULL_45_15]